MVVHPGDGTPDGTIANGLLFIDPTLAELDEGNGRPGIVHRLDKDTSGVLITARTAAAAAALSKAFADRDVEKVYLALTRSWPRTKSPLEGNIGRHPIHRRRMKVVSEGGKTAITHYKLLAAHENNTALAIRIETGRTHQIRVHLTAAGSPVLGDDTYGRSKVAKSAPRQMLHAWQVTFPHPRTGKTMTVTAPVPDDILKVAERSTLPIPETPPAVGRPSESEVDD
jgi:23S rRNA pseudouridine1911/1915/1917 synthase